MELSSFVEFGFIMGLLGSVHCIGMCGPLVMALPLQHLNQFKKAASLSLYFTGKLFSYGMLGVLFGMFGSQLPIFGLQKNISLVMGVAMIIYVFYVFILKPKRFRFSRIDYMYQVIVKQLGILFKSNNLFSYWLIGFLNGLLPCGMIYLALSSAVATQHLLHGGVLMVFFGLGTIPALLVASVGGQLLGFAFRKKIQQMLPVFIFGMGLLLILRGLNLGIPYISPSMRIGSEVISCHN